MWWDRERESWVGAGMPGVGLIGENVEKIGRNGS